MPSSTAAGPGGAWLRCATLASLGIATGLGTAYGGHVLDAIGGWPILSFLAFWGGLLVALCFLGAFGLICLAHRQDAAPEGAANRPADRSTSPSDAPPNREVA